MTDTPSADPKEVVRRFYVRAINERRLDACSTLLAPDFRHNGREVGRGGQSLAVAAFLEGFSDLHHDMLIVLAEGELVSAHQRWRGTHDGPFMGYAPSGKLVDFTSTAILTVRDSMISEAWDVVDLALLQQLQRG